MTTIDYEAARREVPQLRRELTRAKGSRDPKKVLAAVEKAYDRFDTYGAWPDAWHDWRIAVMDAYDAFRRSDEYWEGRTLDQIQELDDRFQAAIRR